MSIEALQYSADLAALQFYLEHGVDEALLDEALDHTALQHSIASTPETAAIGSHMGAGAARNQNPSQARAPAPKRANMPPIPDLDLSEGGLSLAEQAKRVSPPLNTHTQTQSISPVGKSEYYLKAVEVAQNAQSLEELAQALKEFEGLSLKKTASHMLLGDGRTDAKIMLIGDAPSADDERSAQIFAGDCGALLDKILASIDLGRQNEDVQQSVYLSNVLNWRPPGSRSPTPAEIELSLPFIERHIQLIAPDILILCGSISAKALLGGEMSFSKLRKKWHDYMPHTQALREKASPISTIVTYHPADLLSTPAQKRAVWQDMLSLKEKLTS